jgi:hypothetical protein
VSLAAIILMVLAIVILWGGLAVATAFLVRRPLPDVDGDDGFRGRGAARPPVE